MREEIVRLIQLGVLPDENASDEEVQKYEVVLLSIQQPVTDEEARELVKLFSRDDPYTFTWDLIHLIESAPGWPIEECLTENDTEGMETLIIRIEYAKKCKEHSSDE